MMVYTTVETETKQKKNMTYIQQSEKKRNDDMMMFATKKCVTPYVGWT